MDPIDELLQAVFLAPADNTARLVLADYLMDRGDPRGELIQIQCTMATASGSTYDELAARERELLALRAPPENTEVTYARGLCELARVRASWADQAAAFLEGELVIHHLVVHHCGGDWDRVGRLLARLAPKLRTITLENIDSYWKDPDWDGTGGHYGVETVDGRPLLTAMLEATPRPRYFVELQVPDGTTVPPHWRPRARHL